MKKQIVLSNKNLSLRSIEETDISLLRLWKNKNRKIFFHKSIISKKDQLEWYKGYTKREDDYIFIIEKSNVSVGCIGFRKLSDCIDLYNLIIDSKFKKCGYMREALNLLLPAIKKRYKDFIISAKVLKTNNASSWYLKNGFFIKNVINSYYLMEFKQ